MFKRTTLFLAFFLCVALISCSKDDPTPVTPSGGNHNPNNPSSPVPNDGITIAPAFVTLQWTCTDPDAGDTVKFNLYTGSTNPPTNLKVSDYTKTSYDLGLVGPGQRVYWQIVAKDNKGATTTGPVWNFTTSAE